MESVILQPPSMSKILYPHQLRAVAMMEKREREKSITSENFCVFTNVSIFGDLAGYGKTVALVALILRDKMEWDLREPFVVSNISNIYGNGSIIKKSLLRFQKIETSLIVASTSILKQWSDEIFSTPLTHVIITTRKKLDSLEPTLYDIVLCSPSLYNYLVNKYPNYAWKRFIYDEPTQTKIPAMRCIVSGFIWFVSATPGQLLYQNHNNHNFLQSLFSNCMDYHIFQNLIVKNDDDFVKKSFRLPSMHHHSHPCYQPLYNVVQNILSEPICNMIDAGNIEKAVRLLGGSSTSNIFTLIKNEKEELLRETEYKIDKFSRINDHARIKKWTEKKALLEKELEELHRRYKEFILNETCQICLMKNDQPTLVSCCQNAYCGKCIFKWLQQKNSCPNCRTFVTTDMIIYLTPHATAGPGIGTNTDTSQGGGSVIPLSIAGDGCPRISKKTKPCVILEIIEKKPHGKFIIFSDYDETFSFIRHALDDDGIQFAEISGTMESRDKKIREFKQGDINVLFINSIANGAGINLQEATDIILYHRMSDDMQAQIIGRAYRIGREKALDVHHLI